MRTCCNDNAHHPHPVNVIYIECTGTFRSGNNTGIQRTVRNLARHASNVANELGYTVKLVVTKKEDLVEIPQEKLVDVRLDWGRRSRLWRRTQQAALSLVDTTRRNLESLHPSSRWKDFISAPRYRFGLAWLICLPFSGPRFIARLVRSRAVHAPQSTPNTPSQSRRGDILFMPDATWDIGDIGPIAKAFRQQGGYVVTMVHDLIPLSHPEYCVSSLVHAFTKWIETSCEYTDLYICNSYSTESSLRDYLAIKSEADHRNIPSCHFHLGSDLDLNRNNGKPQHALVQLIDSRIPCFLVVGSIEPRKNLDFVLDAFDQAWDTNQNIRLIIVGHNSWKVDSLLLRIRKHPLYGDRLHWFQNASDTDLEYLYQEAHSLIFASRIEGFGLPLVEAMQRGLPVFCSDIPVFHELAKENAQYFSLESTTQLTQLLLAAAEAPRENASHISWLSWRKSCEAALGTIVARHSELMAKNVSQSSC